MEQCKRWWKIYTQSNKKKKPFYWLGLPPVKLSKSVKIVLVVVILTGCFLYGWNYILLKHSWKDITKYTKVPFLSSREASEPLKQMATVRKMFEKGTIQTVMVLGDYTPLSYLAISSLMENIAGPTSKLGNTKEEEEEEQTKPFVFIGSSARLYIENEGAIHTHYGLSLGDHSSGTFAEDMLYQWIHSILETSVWISPDFNFTRVVEEYTKTPEIVKPMIFIDFDILSALCVETLRETLRIAPRTKLFSVLTKNDEDRLKIATSDIYSRSRCVCMKNCKESDKDVRKSSFLFGGDECILDKKVLHESMIKEKDLLSICTKENKDKTGDETYQRCCTFETCYIPSVGSLPKDRCKWREHTIGLSRQKRMFKYLATLFPPEDMFIMDLESYLYNPTPLEKEFSDFLSLSYGVEGKIEGSYTDRNPRMCLQEIMSFIVTKDERNDYGIDPVDDIFHLLK